MWVLLLYVGVSFTVGQMPVGGPTTVGDFQSQGACQAALQQIKDSFGEERPFDQRFQMEHTSDGDTRTRLWTVRGVCVSRSAQ